MLNKLLQGLDKFSDMLMYIYTLSFIFLSVWFMVDGAFFGAGLFLFIALMVLTYTPIAQKILNTESSKKKKEIEPEPQVEQVEPVKVRNTQPKRKHISMKENIQSTKAKKEKREHLKLFYPTMIYPDKEVRDKRAMVPKQSSSFQVPLEDPNPQVLIYLQASGDDVYHAQFLCMNSLTGEVVHRYSIKRRIPNFAKTDKGRTRVGKWNSQLDCYQHGDFKVKVREYFNNFKALNNRVNNPPYASIVCFKEDKHFIHQVLPKNIPGIDHSILTIQQFMEERTSNSLFPRGLNKLEVLKLFGIKRGIKGFFDPVDNLHQIWKSLRDLI